MDLVRRGTLGQDWGPIVSELAPETLSWLTDLEIEPQDHKLWLEALTHGSHGDEMDYQRLEFLGDRVLGLAIAEWLCEITYAAEGKLSQRLNALVSRDTCAQIARRIGLASHIRMGKQARDDGGADSTNILGDVMEALLGASFSERGYEATRTLIRTIWAGEVKGDTGQSKHPKSALQEWAAGNQRKPPTYELVERSGPDHAAKFTVRVKVHKVGEAQATATSKQEAETQAARAFMEQFG